MEEVSSVTSLAGYEILTEGRGSNAGTCIINLKNWSHRKRTARQIIADLEDKCTRMTNVKLEFYEPPAVPDLALPEVSLCVSSTRRTRPTTSSSET